MSRLNRWCLATALTLTLGLAACGGDEPASQGTPTATADPEAAQEADVLEAFNQFYAEQVQIAAAGDEPAQDALRDTATGVVLEETIAQLTQDAEFGTTRKGEPQFKDQMVTVTGDTGLVVTCINTDSWTYVLAGDKEASSDDGWRQLGREMTKVDGTWLVSGYSDENTADECP